MPRKIQVEGRGPRSVGASGRSRVGITGDRFYGPSALAFVLSTPHKGGDCSLERVDKGGTWISVSASRPTEKRRDVPVVLPLHPRRGSHRPRLGAATPALPLGGSRSTFWLALSRRG